ncbi:MAG: LAGLIDADG family homing endonuclease [Nitrospira sp.]|nr:LAGLIDADG family homing endonuclease [Nitrospira sp.]
MGSRGLFFVEATAYNAAENVMAYLSPKPLSPLEAGYLAGLIDGEGTITLSRRNLNKHRALVITISSTELSILKYVQAITGVGKITNKRITKANHTPSFTYQVANRQALYILKQIADYLRSYKADRARLALIEYPRLTPRNGRYSPLQLQERTQFIEKFLGIRPKPLG